MLSLDVTVQWWPHGIPDKQGQLDKEHTGSHYAGDVESQSYTDAVNDVGHVMNEVFDSAEYLGADITIAIRSGHVTMMFYGTLLHARKWLKELDDHDHQV